MIVSSILLRDLIEAGFCGAYAPKNLNATRGRLRFALDLIAGAGNFAGFDDEDVRVQICNQKLVPYPDQPFMHRCLEGLLNNESYFNPIDHECTTTTRVIPGTIHHVEFSFIQDRTMKAFIEPVYDFVAMQDYIPMHSLLCAYLMGLEGTIQVDCISTMAGPFSTKTWGIDKAALQAVLDVWVSTSIASVNRSSSSACIQCDRHGCGFKSDFETKVYAWMKAKQALEALEEEVRHHVTYNGPTKVGAHLVYLKENKRRSLDPVMRAAWLELLKSKRPHDWLDLMVPDGAQIFRLAERNKLSKELLQAFKESRYYTLDTTLTL